VYVEMADSEYRDLIQKLDIKQREFLSCFELGENTDFPYLPFA
jgi:hypothetical protein